MYTYLTAGFHFEVGVDYGNPEIMSKCDKNKVVCCREMEKPQCDSGNLFPVTAFASFVCLYFKHELL